MKEEEGIMGEEMIMKEEKGIMGEEKDYGGRKGLRRKKRITEEEKDYGGRKGLWKRLITFFAAHSGSLDINNSFVNLLQVLVE